MKIEIDMEKPSACYQGPFYRADVHGTGECLILEINDWSGSPTITYADYNTLDDCPFEQEDSNG